MRTQDLAGLVASGDRRACARLISLVENRDPDGLAQLAQLPPGSAFRLGVTGPPGAGKSTLVDLVVQVARAAGERVGVLAVDPSSPFSGGAILGDRVRMQAHATDPGVFIRSMGSRGHLGGLAAATASACRILEAHGCDLVVIETVGAGQSEVEIALAADVVLLVLSPNAGDGIQALKAGIMEIPDLFVVNKADVPGAAATAREIEALLDGPDRVFMTRGLLPLPESGVPELWQALQRLRPPADRPPPPAAEEAVLSEALEIVRERLSAVGAPDFLPGEDVRAAAERWLARLPALSTR